MLFEETQDTNLVNQVKIDVQELERYYLEYRQGLYATDKSEFRLKLPLHRLLTKVAHSIDWSFVPQITQTLKIRPSATFLDMLNYPVGYLEAIPGDKDLYIEIKGKIDRGFPLTNTIFDNVEKAVLYQENKFILEAKLGSREIEPLLTRFFSYQPSDMDTFAELSRNVELISTVQYSP